MPERFASSDLRGPGRDTVSGPRHSQTPEGPVSGERRRQPAVVMVDGREIERLFEGDTLELHTEECGVGTAVRFILVGALALAAGVLSGFFYFWRLFGFGWLSL